MLIGNFSLKDPELKTLVNQLKKNGIKIRILSNISSQELAKNYQEAKVNVLPSQNFNGNFEGFGLIHLEANACGTLTIGCQNTGNEDAIKEGYGFLVPQENYIDLSLKIKEVFNLKIYPELQIQYINSWNNFAKEYEEFWITLN